MADKVTEESGDGWARRTVEPGIGIAIAPMRARPTFQARPHDRIYVASKVKHKKRWIGLRDRGGYNIISSWIDMPDDPEDTMGLVDFPLLWSLCISEAASCDRLIVYHEEGDVLRGALAEVGAALANHHPVIVVGNPDGTWHHHHLVIRAANMEEALNGQK